MGTQENNRSLAAGINPASGAMTAAAPAAPAGGSGMTAGAYDTGSNRDIMITCVNTNRTRIAQIEAALVAAGILPT